MSEMRKVMTGMEKVNEDVVFSVSSNVGMEEGRKPKEAVGESFKTQGLSHYPTLSDEESLAIRHLYWAVF